MAVKSQEIPSVVEHIIPGQPEFMFLIYSHSYLAQNKLLLIPFGVGTVCYINTTRVERDLPDGRKEVMR